MGAYLGPFFLWSLILLHGSALVPPVNTSQVNGFLDGLAVKMGSLEQPTVIYSIASWSYSTRFPEWTTALQNLTAGAAVLGIVSFDRQTTLYFQNRGVSVLHMEDTKDVKWCVLWAKYDITLALLRRGWRVSMSEMDVFWKGNLLSVGNTLKSDIVIEQHNPDNTKKSCYFPNSKKVDLCEEVNIGFYIVRSTPETIALWERVNNFITNVDSEGWNKVFRNLSAGKCFRRCCGYDQKVLDYAIRAGTSDPAKLVLSWEHYDKTSSAKRYPCTKTKEELATLYQSGVTSMPSWEPIPYNLLPHHRIVENQVAGALGGHIWRGASPFPPKQQSKAWALGIYAPSAAEEVARAVKCLVEDPSGETCQPVVAAG